MHASICLHCCRTDPHQHILVGGEQRVVAVLTMGRLSTPPHHEASVAAMGSRLPDHDSADITCQAGRWMDEGQVVMIIGVLVSMA